MAAKRKGRRGREQYTTQMVGEEGEDGAHPPGVGIKTIEPGEAPEDDGGGRRGGGRRGGRRRSGVTSAAGEQGEDAG